MAKKSQQEFEQDVVTAQRRIIGGYSTTVSYSNEYAGGFSRDDSPRVRANISGVVGDICGTQGSALVSLAYTIRADLMTKVATYQHALAQLEMAIAEWERDNGKPGAELPPATDVASPPYRGTPTP